MPTTSSPYRKLDSWWKNGARTTTAHGLIRRWALYHRWNIFNRFLLNTKNIENSNPQWVEIKGSLHYPKVIESWRKNWPRLSSYFQYNKDVRRIMYTTNIIEGFHRQLRAVTKSKGAFQSEDALMKLLFLVQENICAMWNKPVHNWNQTLAQLSIIFGDRLKLNL